MHEPAAAAAGVTVRALRRDEYGRWDALVGRSPQATLFHTPLWLGAAGAPYELFGCFRGDELRAGVAAGLTAPDAAGHPVPWLTPYLGILLPPPADRTVSTLSANKSLTAAMAAFLAERFSSVHFRFPPEVIDLQPFLWQGFQAAVRYTYRLRLDAAEQMLDGMDATRRRNLKTAERAGIVVESPADFSALLGLADQTFARQGRITEFRDAAIRIEGALASHPRSRAFVARSASGVPLGGVWIVWDDRRAYYLIGGHDHAAGTADATALAMWRAIQFTATELGLREFDFEGSMVPAIERFFRKFGGTLLPTYTVTWQRPASLAARVGRRAARLVRGA